MSLSGQDKGIALVTALILSLVAIVLMAAIMVLVVTNTQHSGSVKRYTSCLEATKGGMEDFIASMKNSTWTNPADTNWITGHTCKLKRDTSVWSSACTFCSNGTQCTDDSSPSDIINYADWQKSYGSYTVYAKIIDCKGYADGFLYNIELVGVGAGNEKAWIALVYQLAL